MKKRHDEHLLLLHIGTGKTGTTSLQNYLMRNTKMLEELNWSYPDITSDYYVIANGKKRKKWDGRTALLDLCYVSGWKYRRPIIWKIIDRYLNKANVILSDECVWDSPQMNTEKIIRDFHEHYPMFKVIVYLRRQDLFLESSWNYNTKVSCQQTCSLLDYCEGDKGGLPLDYWEMLQKIEEIIGRENLIVRIYEKGQLKGERGDVTSDFVSALLELNKIGNLDHSSISEMGGYDVGISSILRRESPPVRMNSGLGSSIVQAKLFFNRGYSKYARDEFSELGECFLYLNKTNSSYDLLKYSDRKRILKDYEDGNKQVAIRYLDRTDGVLFRIEPEDQPESETSGLSDCEKRELTLLGERLGMIKSERYEAITQNVQFKELLFQSLCFGLRAINILFWKLRLRILL